MTAFDWDDLRFALAIAEGGSLSAAARALGVNHSTVYRRLGGLEAKLGSRLFDRDAGRLAPTAAGEELVAEAGLGLGLRVGIHTGPAVVDSGGDGRVSGDPGADQIASGATLALGETGELAAVLQGLAPPGEILLSAATHGIVSSFFDTEARSPARVPGFYEPVASYRWLGEAASRRRSGR